MDTTVLKCPGCGSSLPYNAEKGLWVCETCGAEFSEEEILKMFYGLDSVEDTTLKDIGEDLRLSRERVRQIKNKTLRRLQKSKEHKDKLSDFLEH